jgi:ABC-type lipoprotein export system ATPase subunit
VTHDPGVARRCSRVIQLHDGSVVRDGPPSGMIGHGPVEEMPPVAEMTNAPPMTNEERMTKVE